MDKRLEQIKEGAGLEESRLNEELIEFLKKHGDKFSLIILVVALAIVGQRWWHSYQIKQENNAWSEYMQASVIGPESLVQVASDHSKRTGLRLQALTDAADLYLESVRFGLKVHAAMAAMNDPMVLLNDVNEEDRLTDDGRETLLQDADDLYAEVAMLAGDAEEMRLYVLTALFGRAAVAEERQDLEQAGQFYQQVIEQAERFPGLAEWAALRQAGMDELAHVVMPVADEPIATPESDPMTDFSGLGPVLPPLPIDHPEDDPDAEDTPPGEGDPADETGEDPAVDDDETTDPESPPDEPS